MLSIASAHAVFTSVGSGEPAGTVVPHAVWSAVIAVAVRNGEVSAQSWLGGCFTRPFLIIQNVIASPTSPLIIVLSQSNTATGGASGSKVSAAQPFASIHPCRVARFVPYQVSEVSSATALHGGP